jgi:hypothetical protein
LKQLDARPYCGFDIFSLWPRWLRSVRRVTNLHIDLNSRKSTDVSKVGGNIFLGLVLVFVGQSMSEGTLSSAV